MRYTKKDLKCVRDTQSLDRIYQISAPSTSSMESGEEVVIQIAKRAVACFPDIKESQQPRPCPRSLAASHVNTSRIPRTTRRCPVTDRPIPSLEMIEREIDKGLILWNWRWPRSATVRGIALVLSKWAEEVGLEKAARRGEVLLGDLFGGIVHVRNRNGTHEDDDAGDQCVLPSAGTSVEGCGAGIEPGSGRSSRGGGESSDEGSAEGGRLLAFHPRGDARDDTEGLSRRLVVVELQEHQADLKAFQDAYNCIHKRVQEVKDGGQILKLVDWSGTAAVMGSLEMATHAIEHVVQELKQLLSRIDNGWLHNTDEDYYDG